MTHHSFLLRFGFILGATATIVGGGEARAQVTTNFGALPQSSSAKTHQETQARHRSTSRIAPSQVRKHPSNAASSARTAERLSAPERVGAPPLVPVSAPRPVVIVPASVHVPTHPPVAPLPIAAVATAKGATQALSHGLRVIFDPDSIDLSPAMFSALQSEGKRLAKQPHLRVTLYAYAHATPGDLSTPRRLALERALNVRSVLVDSGVATTRIYPRAEGVALDAKESNDRVDLIAAGEAPFVTVTTRSPPPISASNALSKATSP